MENLKRLLESYKTDDRVKRIGNRLKQQDKATIHVAGLVGSLNAFVLAGLTNHVSQDFLVIANDKEEAAYLMNNLTTLFPDQFIHFLPDSFKRPGSFEKINPTNVLQRTETIHLISVSKASNEIVVTYPEALFERVVAPEVLSSHRIEVHRGETLDVDTILEVLIEFGFKKEDFVYEPGQFAIRGGIVDIFSFGNEWPYRIELFDDEVENIRLFDPLSQLSKRNLSAISIVPNINTQFSQQDKVPFTRQLSKDTVIWVRDPQLMIDRLQRCFEQAEQYAKKLHLLEEVDELQKILNDRAFVRPADIMQDLSDFPVIIDNHAKPIVPVDLKVSFSAKPQVSFNKNFNLLIEHLNNNTSKGLENFLFATSTKQIERFYNIFEDLDAPVQFHPIPAAIHEGFVDETLNLVCYTDHQIFERFHRYQIRKGFTKDQAVSLRLLREMRPGDFVTHIDHGIGRYSGLEKININGHVQESVRLIYKNNDILYVSINSLHKLAKYSGKDSKPPQLHKLGSDAWKNLKRKTKKKVKDIAGELIKLYAKRKAAPGHAFPNDGYLQNELEASFIYEDTPDQLKATNEVKEDMMKAHPMDRLICGDVGFGKTEVAIRAAFKAVVGGKQVAVLVPTTILALQHFKSFSDRLQEFGVEVDYVNRFRSQKEKTAIFKNLKEGKIDIVIGTHGLLNKQVGFKDLGLLIVDEEQKFGVSAKEKLRNLKVNVDTLILTATPIPRTLQFSLMAARDLSIIRTPPPNRLPIHTEVRIFNDDLIKESIYYEINRGGQVFFVHNRVKSLPEITAMVRRLCPDVDVGIAHGKMEPKALEQTLLDFIERRYDVLVCTNIIETGLDIPNANTIIINNAHQFGMSDLHQLRGRVGRSNKQAFCYLFSPPMSTLTSEARKRLRTLEEFSDLGSGLNIAMRDLDIRGAGNLLGGEQSGFISEIGYETYQKILEEAVIELKENEFKEVFKNEVEKEKVYVREVQVEVDDEMLIPDNFVENIQERLKLYNELDRIENEEEIDSFRENLRDRFGPVPPEVERLFLGLRLRWVCKKLGFERLIFKNKKLRCYFVTNPQSAFYESPHFHRMLKEVSVNGARKGLSFKKSTRYFILVKDGVPSLSSSLKILHALLDAVTVEEVEN